MNYWVLALYYRWATPEMVKKAMCYDDCSVADLQQGIEKKLVTPQQYKEITGEAI
ncbi:XkdX family protein [Bacillus amyloliquefaciens]|uniref:XkdX family protein n=1 Tax=Bacillus amyloliquefaciens TaxID=1390 RepID=UPI001C05B20C|nr:XkdX family protein [Bacillus amyloliquefaciens]MBU0444427.1 XkdX family protein [Bacillus amyloliquefaciens]